MIVAQLRLRDAEDVFFMSFDVLSDSEARLGCRLGCVRSWLPHRSHIYAYHQIYVSLTLLGTCSYK